MHEKSLLKIEEALIITYKLINQLIFFQLQELQLE